MALFAFALGALLCLAGLASSWASLNLVPTEMGLLYGVCAAVLTGCGAIVLAIGALIVRIGALRFEPPPKPTQVEPTPEPSRIEPALAAPVVEPDIGPLDNFEPSVQAPSRQEPPDGAKFVKSDPQVIGRYAAGGANYVIFSDGTIEAETEDGPMRFTTMNDFRSHIAKRKR